MDNPIPRIDRIALALAVACLLGLAGCQDQHRLGIHCNTVVAYDESGNEIRYTIDGLTDGERFFVVVLVADADESTVLPAYPSAPFSGAIEHGLSRNRKVSWSCASLDAHAGTLTIDHDNFDLAKGAVFLVSLKDGNTEVEQLSVDISRLQNNEPNDQQWAKQVETLAPEIREFIKAVPARQESRSAISRPA